MPPELRWTERATTELDDIYFWVGLDNVGAAERLFWALQQRAEMLLTFPRMGKRRPEIAAQARCLVHGNYLILYELHPTQEEGPVDVVEIVSVIDGRRLLPNLETPRLSA